MVRFLHTADWQMGMKAAKLGERVDSDGTCKIEMPIFPAWPTKV